MGKHLTTRQLSNIDRGFISGKAAPQSLFAPTKPRPFYNEHGTSLCMNMTPANVRQGQLLDLSPSKNHGTMNLNYLRRGGPFGHYVQFNENWWGIPLDNYFYLRSADVWTVECWMKYDNSSDHSVLSNDEGGPVANDLKISGNKITYRHYDGAWYTLTGTISLSQFTWYYFVWVNYANETMDMYVNAVQDTDGGASNITSQNYGKIDCIGRYVNNEAEAGIAGLRVTTGRAKTATELHDYYYGVNGL